MSEYEKLSLQIQMQILAGMTTGLPSLVQLNGSDVQQERLTKWLESAGATIHQISEALARENNKHADSQ
jgi:hypothetical protein